MGASPSCFPRYGCCVPKNRSLGMDINSSSTPKQPKGHRRNLSAAFNLAELGNEPLMEQMNINMATEEELMTLPGITRPVATKIVEYRQQIGGFKKIEDLALVSGVGATRLEVLRLEICVNNKKSSINSSVNSSQQDLTMQDNSSRTSSKSQKSNSLYPRISLNLSNVFQLMKVKGISQQLAENIVTYRDKKGPFHSIDDLVKVRGMKPLLSAVRPFLFLNDEGTDHNGIIKPYSTGKSSHLSSASATNFLSPSSNLGHMSTMDSMGSQETLCSMYGPLGRRSHRVKKRKGGGKKQPTVKVATWNLQQCSSEKTDNLGVREVVAMTILENNLSIIAVQELTDKESLSKLCEELNHPVIPNVKKWEGSRGTWKCVTSEACGELIKGEEYLGFMYDSSQGIELITSRLLTGSSARVPYLAIFQLQDYDLSLVNVHLQSAGLNKVGIDRTKGEPTSITEICQVITDSLAGTKDAVILGDFNTDAGAEEFHLFMDEGYVSVFHKDQYTDMSTRNPEGSRNLDNIWLGMRTALYKTGGEEIIRDGLNSPWIPDGWGWGGLASDHCPAWVELYTTNQGAGSVNNNTEHRVEDVKVALKLSAGGDL